MKTKPNDKIKTRPSEYAEKRGLDYIKSQSQVAINDLGQYHTPPAVAEFIAKNFDLTKIPDVIRVLDPGAGAGILSCALCEQLAHGKNRPKEINLTAYEIDEAIIPTLEKVCAHLKKWLCQNDIELKVKIHNKDFVLTNADILSGAFQEKLFIPHKEGKFDLVVANPPYFKISKSDPRARVASSIVHGQPNIYALFMAVAAELLKTSGQLGFITPRSYASGLYFKKFRQSFFTHMRPFFIHIFELRDKVFGKDNVLQENVILHATKAGKSDVSEHNVRVSSSNNLKDTDRASVINIPLSEVMTHRNGHILRIPTQAAHRNIVKLIASWNQNLHSL